MNDDVPVFVESEAVCVILVPVDKMDEVLANVVGKLCHVSFTHADCSRAHKFKAKAAGTGPALAPSDTVSTGQ